MEGKRCPRQGETSSCQECRRASGRAFPARAGSRGRASRPTDLTMSVLAMPGTPSSSAWPCVNTATRTSPMTSFCPAITRPSSARAAVSNCCVAGNAAACACRASFQIRFLIHSALLALCHVSSNCRCHILNHFIVVPPCVSGCLQYFAEAAEGLRQRQRFFRLEACRRPSPLHNRRDLSRALRRPCGNRRRSAMPRSSALIFAPLIPHKSPMLRRKRSYARSTEVAEAPASA